MSWKPEDSRSCSCCVETLKVMDMTFEVTYAGTAMSNDEIKFSRDVGGVATEDLVAKRVK